jgi:hypothetical protein
MLFYLIVLPLIWIIAILFCFYTAIKIEDPPATHYEVEDIPDALLMDYLDILSDIENSYSKEGLNNIHKRILVFQAYYPEAPALVDEILANFHQKSKMLNESID